MIRSTFKSRGIAAYRYHRLCAELGADHPAARGALGRLLYHQGGVPQRGSTTPEAVAWHRESGAAPGYYNRGERRAER